MDLFIDLMYGEAMTGYNLNVRYFRRSRMGKPNSKLYMGLHACDNCHN